MKVTLEEKRKLLNELITTEEVCTSLSKTDRKILRAIKKDVLSWNKPLNLSPPTIFLES